MNCPRRPLRCDAPSGTPRPIGRLRPGLRRNSDLPGYNINMVNPLRTRENLAWAAGLFEGEGCFSSAGGRGLHASVNMTDEDVVRRFQSVVQMGIIYPRKPARVGWKPQWQWLIGSFEHFQALGAMLWPWLHARRRARFKTILKRYHELEPASFKISQTRTADIQAALATLADVPLWGRRHRSGRTQLSIAREFGVSPSLVTTIKQKMVPYDLF